MISLKDLQQMAKEGKVSEELLKDEEFKSMLKEALQKESDAKITDEQLSEIIKNFEVALQDKQLLKETELKTISGGGVKANAIKYSSAILGATLFSTTGYIFGDTVGHYIDFSVARKKASKLNIPPHVPITVYDQNERLGHYLGTSIGAVSGFEGGWKFGEYLCKKWKIEDK